MPPYSNLLHAVLVHLLCDLLPQNQYLLFPVTPSCRDIITKDVHMKSLIPDLGIHTQFAYIISPSTRTGSYPLGIPSCNPCSLILRLISQSQCLQSSFIDLFTQTSICSHFDVTQQDILMQPLTTQNQDTFTRNSSLQPCLRDQPL